MDPQTIPSSDPAAEASPPRVSFFRRVPWRWSDVLIGFAPPVAVRLFPDALNPERFAGAPRWIWLPAALLGLLWFLAYPLWMAHRRLGGWPPLPRPRTVLVEGALALLFAPLILLVATGIFLVLVGLFGESAMTTSPFESIARSPHRFDWLGLSILAVCVAPFAEEIFFRGLIYNAFRRRWPTIVAAPIQAAIFGVAHRFGPAEMVWVAVAGLGLALFYEWRKTLVAAVLLHAMVNILGLAMITAATAADADAPRLGVYGVPHAGGCRITEVLPGGSADGVGLRVGDVVTALDGQPVANIREMAGIIRTRKLGDKVTVDFIRDATSHRVEAELKPQPPPSP